MMKLAILFVMSCAFIFVWLNCSLRSAKTTKHKRQDQPEGQSTISIIPKPLELTVQSGFFTIIPTTAVVINSERQDLTEIANYLVEKINKATGYNLTKVVNNKTASNAIVLALESNKNLGNEGYELSVQTNAIVINALQPAGIVYGIQTLRQLLPVQIESSEPLVKTVWQVPCVQIKDKPRFQWRGAHLDVCRHFFPKEFVKKYLDIMALHKLNSFHWHLTEDQGWRSEVTRYPKLKEIRTWRVEREDKESRVYLRRSARREGRPELPRRKLALPDGYQAL